MSLAKGFVIFSASALVGSSLGTAAIASPITDQDRTLGQVNSVFQLRDVAPSDWAFDALRNLVENYNCIVGYPDGTYRGDRPLSRYEFAAGLNACLEQIERMIQGGTSEVTAEDLAALRRLVNEFEAELATLGARVDDLEGRVEFLEDHQFSTTTKLEGEVIFALAGAFGDEKADDSGDRLDDQLTFSNRVNLTLNTSFTGDDNLEVTLAAGNIPELAGATGVDTAALGFEEANDNDVVIDTVVYEFPVGRKGTAIVGPLGLGIDDALPVFNPYFEGEADGALSGFARLNPATKSGPDGAGVAFHYDFSDSLSLGLGYLADDGIASSPEEKNGLFNGNYVAGAQLAFSPADRLDLAFSYTNKYQRSGGDVDLSGSTGSDWAREPWGNAYAVSSNNFGIEASWMVSEKFNIAGWVGYTDAQIEDPNNEGSAEIWNWAVNAALLDVGGDGNVLGFVFGQPPKLTSGDLNGVDRCAGGICDDTTYLAELQYRYNLNDNIMITPGAYVIWNPNQNDANETIVVGAIRTTFTF